MVGLARDAEAGGGVVEEASRTEGHAAFAQGDVRREQDIVDAIARCKEEFGGFDFIVNNAGILGEGRLHETSNELWNDLVATHMTGAFWGCKHAIETMRADGTAGSIVNIGSILSFTGDGYLAAYTAMKSGVLGLTKAIAIDYALENNLFAEKAYPQQSEHAFATYQSYVERGRKIPNLRYVGRHAEFKYWGMPETVNAAYQKALAFEPV